MSYLTLNKRQTTGETIKSIDFIFNGLQANISLIKLEKPYKDGTAYSVSENTSNSFCSNGLFIHEHEAINKYYLMLRNCDLITDDEYITLTDKLYSFLKVA